MRILYVLKHNPWGIGGGCYACRNYLQLFSEVFQEAEMDVCICKEYLTPERKKEYPMAHFYPVAPRGFSGKVMTAVTGVMHRHQETVKALLKSNHYDYCVVDHNSIAGSLVRSGKDSGVKTMVLNHNCEYDYFKDNNGLLKRLLFLHQVKKNERKSYLNCDYNIFLTEEDKEQFAEMYGVSNTNAVVGGCFYPKNDHHSLSEIKPFRKEHPKMVISGTMGNVQNMDGINYFLDELLPLVPEDIHIVLAGKNPPASLLERIKPMSPRVIVIPNPKDMDSIVQDCDIFICPARLGGGMKLRVMDGFRNGLPVLAHTVSARGYRNFEKSGMMWEFGTAEEFLKSLTSILNNISSNCLKKNLIVSYSYNCFSFCQSVKRFVSLINK